MQNDPHQPTYQPGVRVIFLSAVTKEFHAAPPGKEYSFPSYRSVLQAAFRTLGRHYMVITQEELPVGASNLLLTLDQEIRESHLVIHLVGDKAGECPVPASLRVLRERIPELLSRMPELRDALGHGDGVSFTQWECYLAIQHEKHLLVFQAEAATPRSPLCIVSPEDRESQTAHLSRIKLTGHHRAPFSDQGDLVRKVVRSFLHFRLDPEMDPIEPSAASVDKARAEVEEIIQNICAAIKSPDPRTVPVTDPANAAAWVAAVRKEAERWQVNLRTIVDIAVRHEEKVAATARHTPSYEHLYDLGFANLALGDYKGAHFHALRAAELALGMRDSQPMDEAEHRQNAQNALFLAHEAAKASHDIPGAISALRRAGELIDKEKEPVLWANTHEPLADYLLDQAQWDQAEEFINEIVDIREEHEPESASLAQALNLWFSLLFERANYAGAEGVIKRALAINTNIFGPDHPNVARDLSNLASLLKATNRLAEAEPLMRRALAIDEGSFGPDHPEVATDLNNLAQLLKATNRLAEAEPLMRRALAIREKALVPDHPDTASSLTALKDLLEATERFQEAAPLRRRALEMQERTLGPDHPDTLRSWNYQSYALRKQGHVDLAEPIDRKVAATTAKVLGDIHPLTIHRRNNLVLTLIMLGNLEEARQILASNWRLNAPPHANTTPRIAFLRHIISLLESQPNTPFLGQSKTLLAGPELPVSSDVAVPWDIAYFIEFLKPKLGEHNAEFLTSLVATLNDRAKLPDLDRFSEWRDQPPVALDVAWPD